MENRIWLVDEIDLKKTIIAGHTLDVLTVEGAHNGNRIQAWREGQ